MPFARQKAPRAYRTKPDAIMPLIPEMQCTKEGCTRAKRTKGLCPAHYRALTRKPHVIKNWYLKNKYGITLDQFNAMREAQGFKCGICGKHETQSFGPWKENGHYGLAVDHNHTTGAIRELLCPSCNTLVAQVEKDPMQALRVLDYLARHQPSSDEKSA